MAALTGFQIRPPHANEQLALDALLGRKAFQSAQSLRQGAYGVPGDHLVGGFAVRPGSGGKADIAHFVLKVPEFARRKGVGRRLIHQLYQLALANRCQRLICGAFLADASPEHRFAQAMWMEPERSYLSWHFTVTAGHVVATPAHERFRHKHSQVKDLVFQKLEKAAPQPVADFLTQHYGGFSDHHLREIQSGILHPRMSVIALQDERVVGVGITDLRKASFPYLSDAAHVRLIAVADDFKTSPLALCLCKTLLERFSAEGSVGRVFYDADPVHDPFATTFAKKCGAQSGDLRHRMSISGEDMADLLKS